MPLTKEILDFLLPRRCVMCGGKLAPDEDAVCLICNMSLPRLNLHADPYENSMAKMYYGKVELERAAAFLNYEGHSATVETAYSKYYGRPDVSEAMGRIMAQEMMEHGFFDGMDAIVPVPLASRRLFERTYNQSLYIARGVAIETGIKILDCAMTRIRFQKSQASLIGEERFSNVEDSFCIVDSDALAGKHLLLIDDVVTSGATSLACIRKIKEAADCKVSLLSLFKAGHFRR